MGYRAIVVDKQGDGIAVATRELSEADLPAGEVTMQDNHHLVNNVYIGETLATGQFKVIKSFTGMAGEPFSEKFLK